MADSVAVKKGGVIITQGTLPENLIVLESGKAEILSASKEYEGLDPGIIVSKSRRLGLVEGKNLLAAFSENLDQPYTKSLRAVEECRITGYPLNSGGFRETASKEPARAASVIKQSFSLLNSLVTGMNRYFRLLQTLQIMNDNISILYKSFGGSYAPDEFNDYAEDIFNDFHSAGGRIPDELTAKFIVSDPGRYLNKNYDPSGNYSLSKRDRFSLDLIMKLFRLDNDTLGKVVSADRGISVSAFNIIIDSFNTLFDSTEGVMDAIESELLRLFSDELSWATILTDDGGFDEWIETGKIDQNFIRDTLNYIVKINSLYEDLWGKKITDSCPGVKKIHQYYMKIKESTLPENAGAPEQSVENTGETISGKPSASSGGHSVVTDLKKSMHQIFEFSLIEKEFQTGFVKLLSEFRNQKSPMSSESDSRKLRRQISRMYWELYKQVYLRSRTEPSVPKAVRLMLNYGFVDEEMVEPEQLMELNQLIKRNEPAVEIPVLMEVEFLNLVYAGEVEPSINEMGLNYQQYLLEMQKHRKQKDNLLQVDDESINKVLFEIDQRLATTVSICSGSPSTAFPILTSYGMKGEYSSFLVTKRRVEQIIDEIRDLDFSAFYRETVLRLGESREIIKEEVVPYFVIVPAYGTKTQLWQDMIGSNRRSKGRIFIPVFFMGDLKKSLAHTVACFRWELNRTMKGALWGDPVDGGLTGEYFDYVNSYKKMTKLSQEAKEKVTERFRGLRTNRDRFADDYCNWILYEKDGIMKLNSIVREIFCKHIPFKKELRERLLNMPAFTKTVTRYNNLNMKEVEITTRRLQKYAKEDGTLPPEIEQYLKLLEM